MRAVSSCSR